MPDAFRTSHDFPVVFLARPHPAAHSPRVAEENDENPMSELLRALEASDCSALLAAAEDIHYADLAHLYENLDDEKRDLLLKTIGPELATDVVAELPYPLIEDALNHFKPAQLRVLLGNLSDDDRVDVFQVVSEEAQVRFFSLLGPRDKELTRNLLKYDEDTAGGRMTTQVGRITADMTVKQAITVLRRDRDDAETLARIFVVDEQGRLVGKVRLRDLAFSTWDTPVHDIMEPADETILASADQEEAARTLSKYDLIVLPVVDEFHHLLGVLTYDDALEILQEESTEDIEKLSGIGGEQSEVSYLNTSVALPIPPPGFVAGRAGVSIDRLGLCDVSVQRGAGKGVRARAVPADGGGGRRQLRRTGGDHGHPGDGTG